MGILRTFGVSLFFLVLCSGSADAEIKSRFYFKDFDAEEGTVLTEADFQRARNLKDFDDQDVYDSSSMENPDLFQGDILEMTDKKLIEWDRKLVSELESENTPFKSAKRSSVLWTNGVIPYVIDKDYAEWERTVIAGAILDFHKSTCIKFVPRTDEKDYIYIYKGASGKCASYLGKWKRGGKQPLWLGLRCIQKSKVIHEFMHALGFVHEHQRPDRDDYVTIIKKNIMKGQYRQFKKYDLWSVRYLNTTYDYGSVMHYGNRYFGKTMYSVRQITIVPKKAGVTIGQRNGFSTIDILRINRLYKCPTAPTPTSTPL